jgi:hypothetical protein
MSLPDPPSHFLQGDCPTCGKHSTGSAARFCCLCGTKLLSLRDGVYYDDSHGGGGKSTLSIFGTDNTVTEIEEILIGDWDEDGFPTNERWIPKAFVRAE